MDYEFPREGLSYGEVVKKLYEKEKNLVKYQEGTVLGFPGTYPHPIALEAFANFMRWNPNNIMTHTRSTDGEEGEEGAFKGSQDLEREVVYMLGNLLGASKDKPVTETIDGYIASGGTEANIMALWIARNKLSGKNAERECSQKEQRKICVIAPVSVHYSIRKACDLLGIGEGAYSNCGNPKCEIRNHVFQPSDDGSGLILVDLDEEWKADPSDIEEKIDQRYERGIDSFILVGTAGTTLLGTFDPIENLGRLIYKKSKEYGLRFFFHVDAAFGGLVAPFIGIGRNVPKFDFSVPQVDSLSVDPHKMGMVPYPAGVFLCRKHLQENIERYVGYISTHIDDTVIGSRPGASAASCWALFRYLGRRGFKEIVSECMENTRYLESEIERISGTEVIVPPTINILGVGFSKKLAQNIRSRYCLVRGHISRSHEECPREIYKFVIMPHVTKGSIDKFIGDLRRSL